MCSAALCWTYLVLHRLSGTAVSALQITAHCFIYIYHSLVFQGPIAPPFLCDTTASPSASCPPPPPPPPGPPPLFTDGDSQPQMGSEGAQHSALFAQLNQGMDITKGGKQ